MAKSPYSLPPLTALAAFEAAARNRSFKIAAVELNVTPGAISKQVRVVEERVNAQLFLRGASGVSLTTAGEHLYSVLSNAFQKTSEVIKSIEGSDQVSSVTMACSDSFATLWLIPRMKEFWLRFPYISVDHLITDDSREYRRAEVELRIRYGTGTWADETAILLFDEMIYPVCGVGFFKQNAAATASDIASLPLLHVDWDDPQWTDWSEFLHRSGLFQGGRRGRRFSKYSVTLEAAEANLGVALGWHRLVRHLVESNALQRLTDLQIVAPGGYYLTWNASRPLSPAAVALKDWLFEIAACERADSG